MARLDLAGSLLPHLAIDNLAECEHCSDFFWLLRAKIGKAKDRRMERRAVTNQLKSLKVRDFENGTIIVSLSDIT